MSPSCILVTASCLAAENEVKRHAEVEIHEAVRHADTDLDETNGISPTGLAWNCSNWGLKIRRSS